MEAINDLLSLDVAVRDFALIVNMSAEGVRQWIKQGVIPVKRQNPYRINVKDGLHAYLAYIKDRKNDAPAMPADDEKAKSEKLRADADLSIAKARQEELKLAELKGQLHRSEDVQAMTEDLVYTVRGALMSLPGRLAMDVSKEENPNVCTRIIRDEVALILENLSGYEYSREKYMARMKERMQGEEIQKDEEDDE